jgi:hypothetical protein
MTSVRKLRPLFVETGRIWRQVEIRNRLIGYIRQLPNWIMFSYPRYHILNKNDVIILACFDEHFFLGIRDEGSERFSLNQARSIDGHFHCFCSTRTVPGHWSEFGNREPLSGDLLDFFFDTAQLPEFNWLHKPPNGGERSGSQIQDLSPQMSP